MDKQGFIASKEKQTLRRIGWMNDDTERNNSIKWTCVAA
jgi:hypothetical protein